MCKSLKDIDCGFVSFYILFFSVVTVIEIGIETAVFSNIEPYRNRGFRLSIDGFGFLVNGTALMSGAVNVRPNSTQPR